MTLRDPLSSFVVSEPSIVPVADPSVPERLVPIPPPEAPNLLHELNAWRELGEEMGRILSSMSPEQYEDLCPDWFGPRLFDLQVKPIGLAASGAPPSQEKTK